jgi:hypothetical protein
MKKIHFRILALSIAMSLAVTSIAVADLGDIIDSFQPSPHGNGRAVAFDGSTLYYTFTGDTNIYMRRASDHADLGFISTNPAIYVAALAWDPGRNVLWAGSYSGDGYVYTVALDGTATYEFTFVDTSVHKHGFAAYIDGLAYDPSDDTLWISGDEEDTVFHYTTAGGTIGSFETPDNRENSGIANAGTTLWLALFSSINGAPRDIVQVDKMGVPTGLSFNVGDYGPEDLELDKVTFSPGCVLWSNSFGGDLTGTILRAFEVPCPVIEVYVDIKPGSCPNPLNTKSKGVLPVAICGTEDFDVTTIDPATVQLEGVSPIRWAYEDVATPFMGELCDCHELTGDGILDMTFKFDTQEIVAALGAVTDGEMRTLTLTGSLMVFVCSEAIEGHDCVRIIHK